ncbi:MAG: tyrosine-type recombinase/integrase [bacterium]
MGELAPRAPADRAIVEAIERSDLAPSTKRKYVGEVRKYVATGASLTDAEALASYAADLPKSRRAFLKAAVSRWAEAMATQVKAQATPDNLDQVQATLYRFEALQSAISVSASNGTKAHTWLSPAQVRRMMQLPGQDLAGRRDHVALALLVGAGLRRLEAVRLSFDDVGLQAAGKVERTVLEVDGKGAKLRVVPVSTELAATIAGWGERLSLHGTPGGSGRILRSVDAQGQVGDSLSAVGLFNIVRGYGRRIGVPTLAPHDLRRTFAQIAYDSGVPITQISKLLGHASVATTQRYLNLDLDLQTTASDFIPL